METIKTKHSITKIGYHLIWCTKFRQPILKNIVEVECKKIFADICITYGWKIRNVEIMSDHVHLFIQCDHTISPIQIVKTLKSISAIYLFTKFPNLKGQKFWGSGLWSKGAYYSTVGHISEEVVQRYIKNQKSS